MCRGELEQILCGDGTPNLFGNVRTKFIMSQEHNIIYIFLPDYSFTGRQNTGG